MDLLGLPCVLELELALSFLCLIKKYKSLEFKKRTPTLDDRLLIHIYPRAAFEFFPVLNLNMIFLHNCKHSKYWHPKFI